MAGLFVPEDDGDDLDIAPGSLGVSARLLLSNGEILPPSPSLSSSRDKRGL